MALFSETATPGREGPQRWRVVVWGGTTPKVISGGHHSFNEAMLAAAAADLLEYAIESYRERTSDADLAARGLQRL